MKLTFTGKDGTEVTATAEDANLVLAEAKQGDNEDFVMLRFKPGTLTVSTPADSHTWRMPGAAQ